MKHEIDLSKYLLRTDLAIETVERTKSKKGVKVLKKIYDEISVINVIVDENGSKSIKKKPGKYVTIEFQDVTDEDNRETIIKIFIKELKKIVKLKSKRDHVLVVGLGNENSTPDSLGPITVNKLIITNHLYELGLADDNHQRVSAFNPSVMGKTGIETSDILLKLVDLLKPDMVIVIDALASGSISRVNKTIQMTDTGIHPGSGIGNKRKEISKEVLGIPVIAIGVPTVVDAVTIVSDTIKYLINYFNVTKSKMEINTHDNENLLGVIGTLDEEEVKMLINDVLTSNGHNLMVTPKEIDFILEDLSSVLSKGINSIFHNR